MTGFASLGRELDPETVVPERPRPGQQKVQPPEARAPRVSLNTPSLSPIGSQAAAAERVRLVRGSLQCREQRLELGELDRSRPPPTAADRARERAERDLRRRGSECRPANEAIARIAHCRRGRRGRRSWPRVERGARAPQALRRARQRLGVSPSFASASWLARTLARSKRGSALLGSSAKADARLRQRGGEPRLGHIEQRTQHGDPGPGAHLRDRGKPVEPAAALEPHEEGLGLIVEMMRRDQSRDVMGMAIGRHEVVARLPRAGLNASLLAFRAATR